MGRPTDFSPAIADEICERIANGESLRAICQDDGLPARSTVFRWLADEAHVAFRDQYARAREAQADALADDIVHLADTPALGEIVTEYPVWEGKGDKRKQVMRREVRTGDNVERTRLQIDARKWFASKVAPKKYGDRLELGGSVRLRHEDALDALDEPEGTEDPPAAAG